MEKKNAAEILKVAWIKVGDSSYGLQEDPLGIYYRFISVIDNDILKDINHVKDIDFSKDIDNLTYSLNYKFIVKLLKHYPKEKELLKNKKIDYIIVQDDTEYDEEEVSDNQDSVKNVVKDEERHSVEILKIAWIKDGLSYSSCYSNFSLFNIDSSYVAIIDNNILKNIDLVKDIDSDFYSSDDKFIFKLLKHYPKETELLKNKKIGYIIDQSKRLIY